MKRLPADNIYGNGFTVVCSTDVHGRNMLVLNGITYFIRELPAPGLRLCRDATGSAWTGTRKHLVQFLPRAG